MENFIKELQQHSACADSIQWVRENNVQNMAEAWDKCNRSDWMMWAYGCLLPAEKRDDKLLRIYACRCVRETPLPDGRKVWDLLTDERSRNAVEVAERFANGEATSEEMAAAWAAAEAAARDAAWDAAWAARAAARAAAWDAAWDARDAAWDAQANLLREIFGNPFKG